MTARRINSFFVPVLVAGLLALGACAGRQPEPPRQDTPLWQRFQENQARLAADQDAFLLSASALLTQPSQTGPKTNRVTLDFWGRRSGPLRLDVRAGVGAPLLMVRESPAGVLAYAVQDNAVLYCATADDALGRFNLPFGLIRLASVLYGPLDVPRRPFAVSADTVDFGPGAAIGSVSLDESGRPSDLAGEGWSAILEYDGEEQRPSRVRLSMENGASVLIRVKSLEPRGMWPSEALALDVPPSARVLPCSRN